MMLLKATITVNCFQGLIKELQNQCIDARPSTAPQWRALEAHFNTVFDRGNDRRSYALAGRIPV